jgi:hypothetical protein
MLLTSAPYDVECGNKMNVTRCITFEDQSSRTWGGKHNCGNIALIRSVLVEVPKGKVVISHP